MSYEYDVYCVLYAVSYEENYRFTRAAVLRGAADPGIDVRPR